MSETLFDIPTKDLPSANEGEVIFGQLKVESVTVGIAHVTFTPSTRSKPAPGARTWAERIAGKGGGDHLRDLAESDERLTHILNKHAPGYLD